MFKRTLTRKIALASVMGALVAGCQSTKPEPNLPEGAELATCPETLQSRIAFRASVSARDLPKDFVTSEGVAKQYPFVGRRILIAVAPHGAARQLNIIESDLAVTPFGGTFNGWATFSRSAAAVDVVPGRLRVDPFLPEGPLRAQTSTVETVVRLGGGAFDQSVIATTALWDSAQRPISPDVLQLTLAPARHFTVYDAAKVRLSARYVARPARDALPCAGTLETEVQLVDREAARPPLWDLGTSHNRGARKRWLALYDPATGPVRAIFADPVAARGFAQWAQQTAAIRAGRFKLGTFDAVSLGEGLANIPDDSAIMESYRPITNEERADLKVGPLAEP